MRKISSPFFYAWNIGNALEYLDGERAAAAVALTAIVVASPMAAYYIARKIHDIG